MLNSIISSDLLSGTLVVLNFISKISYSTRQNLFLKVKSCREGNSESRPRPLIDVYMASIAHVMSHTRPSQKEGRGSRLPCHGCTLHFNLFLTPQNLLVFLLDPPVFRRMDKRVRYLWYSVATESAMGVWCMSRCMGRFSAFACSACICGDLSLSHARHDTR
jgi:hypothetical protein